MGAVGSGAGGDQRHEESTTERPFEGRDRRVAARHRACARADRRPDGGLRGRLARYMLQVAMEEEATAFLGRGHYRRGDRQRLGWRTGYEPKRVQSEAGVLELAVPQLRGTTAPFRPPLVDRLGTRTADLEDLVRGMYVRGLSTQDVSTVYGETVGTKLSKSTVSRITQRLTADFDTWRRRDLSELPVVYLFLDGQYHAARQGTDEKEGVLSA
jgi:putative transposase